MTSAGGVTYTYDGDGNRVMKSSGTIYWYGGEGNALQETDLTGANSYTYYFFNGQRIARRKPNNSADHYAYDHLGNARWVIGGDGTWTVSEFYPFGGERVIQSASNNHYKFTGKERDSESGLDNFGARFDSSTLGRFISPDPLLNSGRPWAPQTWNRYAYARNNPLNMVDPTGLYDLVNNCASDDKKCNKQFMQQANDLKRGLADLQKKVDKMKDGPEKDRLEAALKVLGTEGDHNGVNATFGALAGTAAAETKFDNPENGPASATITFDPSKNSNSNEYAVNAAHEGTHVEDDITGSLHSYAENALSTPSWLRSPQLSDFSLEYRGYQTSAWAAQALGFPSLSYQGVEIWNRSWSAADRQTLMDRGITQHVTSIPGHPETTPHNPWPN